MAKNCEQVQNQIRSVIILDLSSTAWHYFEAVQRITTAMVEDLPTGGNHQSR